MRQDLLNDEGQIHDLAQFLKGYAAGLGDAGNTSTCNKIIEAARWLGKFEREVCGQGFVCNGGPGCTSDHK